MLNYTHGNALWLQTTSIVFFGRLSYFNFIDMIKNSSKFSVYTLKIEVTILFLAYLYSFPVISQPTLTNQNAHNVLIGNYNIGNYLPSVKITDKDSLIDKIFENISADSLKSYLTTLETFQTRNSSSDTVSSVRGIGAARRWIHSKFESFSLRNEDRLLVSYLNFNSNMCGVNAHKNVLGVLPGIDTSYSDVLVVEAHMDSRCESTCDTSCYAPGMDDNGSGTALVMELARVMSQFSYNRTIIFTTVTGEEQGLRGGEAMATYLKNNNIDVLACLNNDVVGGIECGPNSSPPSCSPVGTIDSINLRVFSFSPGNDSNFISVHKELARYVKLQQIEEMNTRRSFNSNIHIQIREDRMGRGGDHIPFRQRQYRAIRFTSSHEHGDGSGNSPDRQHTTTDVLGYDLSVPPDGILDTFLVDFNYLKRNVLTNAISLTMLAKSPPIPEPLIETFEFENTQAIRFEKDDTLYSHKVGVRSTNSTDLYFDTVLTFHKHYIEYSEIYPKGNVQLHFMNLDGEIESLPTTHISDEFLGVEKVSEQIKCLEAFPNPAENYVNLKWKCAVTPEVIEIKLVNAGGLTVYNSSITETRKSGNIQIDISSYPVGIYQLMYIINKDEVFSEALIIQ